VRITIPPLEHATADQLLLLGDVRALEERVIQRRVWSAPSVRELLQAAASAGLGVGDVDKGREAFTKAEALFQADVGSKNRMFYLLGALIGIVVVAALVFGVLAVAAVMDIATIATRDTVIAVATFAGMGSAASVLTRLSTIDLSNELRRKWVVTSAATRPLLAVIFASVIYVVLQNGIVSFEGLRDEPAKSALIWIASFLCGFSERFAIDILERVPFLGSKSS
jgi:hypothetical protein